MKMKNTQIPLYSTIALDVLYGLENFTVENPGCTRKYWISVKKIAYIVIHLLT